MEMFVQGDIVKYTNILNYGVLPLQELLYLSHHKLLRRKLTLSQPKPGEQVTG